MRNRVAKKVREEHKTILIALEDKKSSRFYIKELAKDKGISLKVAFAKHIGTDPKSVLLAIEDFEINNPNVKYEKAWLVIDKDSFSAEKFKCTLETCRHRNICVAYSNECYELWLLLHFKDVTGYKSRDVINKELNQEFLKHFKEGYSKSKNVVYGMLRDRQNDAIKRAENLIKNIKKRNGTVDPFTDNPSTTMHILINCLNNLKSCKKNNYNNCNKI